MTITTTDTEDKREQPWKKWLAEEIDTRQRAVNSESGKEDQQKRRTEYLSQLDDKQKLGGGGGNKAG
jgi:ribosomal protein S4